MWKIIKQESQTLYLWKRKNNIMKVSHFSTFRTGGAGIAAKRLDNGLNAIGLNSRLIASEDLNPFSANSSLCDKAFKSLSYRYNSARGNIKDFKNNVEIFTFPNTPFKKRYFKQIPEDTDIINLHWIADFIDYKSFFGACAGRVPIIWTLHDANPFLGGCHYFEDTQYLSEKIGKGLSLGDKGRSDIDNEIYLFKKRIYDSLQSSQLHFVAPSKWLATEAKKSYLLSRFGVSYIPYSLDPMIFKPMNKKFCRELFNISEEAKVIMFCADSIKNKRKGFDLLLESFAKLPEDITCIAIGDAKEPVENTKITFLGKLTDERIISCAYNSADLFVIPSREDNLPNTVLESIACGTPVIGSNVGGIPDMVRDGETGFLFEKGNSEDLARKIKFFFSLSEKERKEMSHNCRRIAEKEYALEIQAKTYMKLYEEILDNKQSNLSVNQ